MSPWWLVSSIALWLVVLFLGFLLLGALRALSLLRWRLELFARARGRGAGPAK
jgi:hypothetical protein